MDVAADFEEVALLFDQMTFESALQQMADTAMATVEVAGVAAVEKLHAGREVCLGRFDEEVVVVVHQHEGVQPPPVGLDGPPQPVEPFFTIGVVSDDPSPLISTGHQMVQRPGKLDSQRSSHGGILPA